MQAIECVDTLLFDPNLIAWLRVDVGSRKDFFRKWNVIVFPVDRSPRRSLQCLTPDINGVTTLGTPSVFFLTGGLADQLKKKNLSKCRVSPHAEALRD